MSKWKWYSSFAWNRMYFIHKSDLRILYMCAFSFIWLWCLKRVRPANHYVWLVPGGYWNMTHFQWLERFILPILLLKHIKHILVIWKEIENWKKISFSLYLYLFVYFARCGRTHKHNDIRIFFSRVFCAHNENALNKSFLNLWHIQNKKRVKLNEFYYWRFDVEIVS